MIQFAANLKVWDNQEIESKHKIRTIIIIQNLQILLFHRQSHTQQISQSSSMFNPGQMQKSFHPSVPLIKNANHIVLDNITSSKSKWDQPIQIPPVLYSKFNVPLPHSSNQNSNSNSRQVKSYPKSLLDYIKRAYEKCKDENQKILMEKQLRDIVRNFQSDFNQIAWDSYPLPNLQENPNPRPFILRPEIQPMKSKLSQIRLPSSYNIIEEQKPSKAMEIAIKKLQKLQQKFNRPKKQDEQVEPQKQVFIGFSAAPNQQAKQRFQLTPPPVPVPAPISITKPTLTLTQLPNPTPIVTTMNKKNPVGTSTNGLGLKQSITPTILKYQINQKPIQKFKDKDRAKEKEKEKEKEKDKQKQKQKYREKQKSRHQQKEKEKQKTKLTKQTKQTKKDNSKRDEITKNQAKSDGTKLSKKEEQAMQKSKQKQKQMNNIAKRFKDFYKLKTDNYQKDAIQDGNQDIDFQQVIVGKSQSIEKPYLRITGRPNPDTVRPEPVLRKALTHFLDKYKKDKNYEYLISQLRSVRQDLTVQHIKNSFTVQVYEQNLQISLYEKDIPQFKHCQTTLWQLYSQGHFYTQESRNKFVGHQMITLIMEDKSQEMQFMLTKVPERILQTPQVQSCLKLKQILLLGNYCGFFGYFRQQDRFIKCLLELYIEKMYIKFLLMICRTCGQKVPIKSISKIIGQSEQKIEQIVKSQNGIILNGMLVLKPSYEQLLKSQHLVTKKVTVLLG